MTIVALRIEELEKAIKDAIKIAKALLNLTQMLNDEAL